MLLSSSLFALAIVTSFGQKSDALTIHSMFRNFAVLQRNTVIELTGLADSATDQITVQFDNNTPAPASIERSVFAECGAPRWKFSLDTNSIPSGGEHTLKVSNGKTTVVAKNLVVGDVIVCHGQSNAVFKVGQSAESASGSIPSLRAIQFEGGCTADACPLSAQATWANTPKDSVSAVCYFAAQKMQSQGVPVGVVVPAASNALLACPAGALPNPQMQCLTRGHCVNNMRILAGMKAAGLIWYQGETDAIAGTSTTNYASSLTSFIEKDIRSNLQAQTTSKQLPITLVQLPKVAPKPAYGLVFDQEKWNSIRDAQLIVSQKLSSVRLIEAAADPNGDMHPPSGKKNIGDTAADFFMS